MEKHAITENGVHIGAMLRDTEGMNELTSRLLVYLLDKSLEERGFKLYDLQGDDFAQLFGEIVPIAVLGAKKAEEAMLAMKVKEGEGK